MALSFELLLKRQMKPLRYPLEACNLNHISHCKGNKAFYRVELFLPVCPCMLGMELSQLWV